MVRPTVVQLVVHVSGITAGVPAAAIRAATALVTTVGQIRRATTFIDRLAIGSTILCSAPRGKLIPDTFEATRSRLIRLDENNCAVADSPQLLCVVASCNLAIT